MYDIATVIVDEVLNGILLAGEMMGKEKVSAALHENWYFFKMNIVITPELLRLIVEQGVMSQTMVDDVMVSVVDHGG